MAIKYYPIPEKKQTIAVLEGTAYDVYNKIDKIRNQAGFNFFPTSSSGYEKYLLPDTFKVVVTCDPRDTYDPEVGKKEAKKKLMRNYYRAVDKRMNAFVNDVTLFAAMVRTSPIATQNI